MASAVWGGDFCLVNWGIGGWFARTSSAHGVLSGRQYPSLGWARHVQVIVGMERWALRVPRSLDCDCPGGVRQLAGLHRRVCAHRRAITDRCVRIGLVYSSHGSRRCCDAGVTDKP